MVVIDGAWRCLQPITTKGLQTSGKALKRSVRVMDEVNVGALLLSVAQLPKYLKRFRRLINSCSAWRYSLCIAIRC